MIIIIEAIIIVVLIVVLIVVIKISEKKAKENSDLKLELLKAREENSYVRNLMELKDEAYKNAKEKNKKLDEGSIHQRIDAAGGILCNKQD